MRKQRRTHPVWFGRQSRQLPYPRNGPSRQHRQPSSSYTNPPETHVAATKDLKEWDEVRCPVCMEHPHNAVLLLCSSHAKGCRPFMCNTSYRHSNCHDQYRKSFLESSPPTDPSCPLCRGRVIGLIVVDPARQYMNTKVRTCSKESCGFSGTYGELRKHARSEHPFVRPSVADPERQREWRMMEQERELGDVFSTTLPAVGREDEGLGMLEEVEPEITLTVTAVFYVRGDQNPGGANTIAERNSPGHLRSPTRRSSRSWNGRTAGFWSEPPRDTEHRGRAGGDGGDNEDGNNNSGSEEASGNPWQSLGRPQQQPWMDNDFDDGYELLCHDHPLTPSWERPQERPSVDYDVMYESDDYLDEI